MMQDVLRYGTGASVRSRGFTLPAAGKTGTSRDGWFAGFTSELLCVVWVGFDDGRELNLEGAHSALPVWAEFMKRAAQFRQYRDAKPFQQPSGIVSVKICADSGQLAGEFCPDVRSDVFINGTQPAVECEMHALGAQQYADRVIEDGGAPVSATTGRETVAPAQRQIIVLPRPSSPTTKRQTVPPAPPVQAPASGRQTIPPAPPATNRRPTTPPALPPGAPPTALPGRGQ
jgi:penicillin-binding protein 1B